MVKRGDLWWASLQNPRGSAPGYDRPVVVVQSDLLNETAIGTCLCAIVTSNLGFLQSEGNVSLRTDESRLAKDSVVNVTQLLAIDRADLVERVTSLTAKTMRKIDSGIRFALDL